MQTSNPECQDAPNLRESRQVLTGEQCQLMPFIQAVQGLAAKRKSVCSSAHARQVFCNQIDCAIDVQL
eukprot:6065661-Pleurochrysis_carterae.AAC.1